MPRNELEVIGRHPRIERIRKVLGTDVAHPIGWVIPEERPKELSYTAACRTCSFVRRPSQRRICQGRFLASLEASHRTRAPVEFLCPIQRYAVCLPVVRQEKVEGYLAICHSERAFPRGDLELARLALEGTVAEMEQAQELKNLSESIQPRCVALSTVHTIHRLISSTLNLQELLPRIARLCCQVLRAQSCTIWLLDPRRKRLVPRAVVEAGTNGIRVPAARANRRLHGGSWGRPYRVGEGIPGKVASTVQAVWKKSQMFVPMLEEETVGVIQVRRRRGLPFGTLDREILTTLSEQAVVAIRNAQMYEAQERITWGTIKSLSDILDGMDTRAPGRSPRRKALAEVALSIAQRMRLSEGQQRPLQYAALLHDAGRVGIPEEILRKPSKLAPDEFARVKEHPIQGARLLQPLEVLEPALPIILHHHERYDGTGYPKGLKGEAIPLGARILAVANAFEAMICDRPYRQALSVSKAAQEIGSHAGTQFDPKVVEAFLGLERSGELERIVKSR